MRKDKKIGFIVIFAVIMSFFVFRQSFAIYKKSITNDGNITSATWNVFLNQSGVGDHLSIVADPNGTTASYTLNITNNSEVDVRYSIELDGLSEDVSVSIDGGNTFTKENNGMITFNNVGTINYANGGNTVSKTLIFKALSTAEFVTDNAIDIKVITKQVI